MLRGKHPSIVMEIVLDYVLHVLADVKEPAKVAKVVVKMGAKPHVGVDVDKDVKVVVMLCAKVIV